MIDSIGPICLPRIGIHTKSLLNGHVAHKELEYIESN